jgi:hypothetical protein
MSNPGSGFKPSGSPVTGDVITADAKGLPTWSPAVKGGAQINHLFSAPETKNLHTDTLEIELEKQSLVEIFMSTQIFAVSPQPVNVALFIDGENISNEENQQITGKQNTVGLWEYAYLTRNPACQFAVKQTERMTQLGHGACFTIVLPAGKHKIELRQTTERDESRTRNKAILTVANPL